MASKKSTKKRTRYIFVVGGVMSGVGKGVTSSSIGAILKARGLAVTSVKIDPYINIDAGTLNPTRHGEVFVLNDGDETDQDMGNYERFLNQDLTSTNYMTTGRVYQEVIRRERSLEYGGRDVEVIPDIPREVIRRVRLAGEEAKADVVITEVGGTIGEYQTLVFYEAIRMLKIEQPEDVLTVMVSYLPAPKSIGEMKTKPTQYASRTLNCAGIQADIIVARAGQALDEKRKQKIATFCNINKSHVISAPDVPSIYEIPLNFEKAGLGDVITGLFGMRKRKTNLKAWSSFSAKTRKAKDVVSIAVVGKYFGSGNYVLSDVYLSILEGIKFSACASGVKAEIAYLDSTVFEKDPRKLKELKQYDGVLVPGGFGSRGIEGKIKVIEYVRKNKIPYFGICYGMQLMVIEYARNVMKLKDVHTTEIKKTAKHPIIDILPEQISKLRSKDMGGTMRLGAYPCKLVPGTIAAKAYGTSKISERHRHRYEVNPEYIDQVEAAGLKFSGKSPNGVLMEIAELPTSEHPFFLGVQFHPEFLARPLDPHPIFTAFIKAAVKKGKK